MGMGWHNFYRSYNSSLFWAIKIIIYIAFISLFVAIVATAIYHFYWLNKEK